MRNTFPVLSTPLDPLYSLQYHVLDDETMASIYSPNAVKDIEGLLEKGRIFRLAVPLSQIVMHDQQRVLNTQGVEDLISAFGDDPTARMRSDTGTLIPLTPEFLPVPNGGPAQIYQVVDPRLRFSCIDGQHRMEALRQWTLRRDGDLVQTFWIFDILHSAFIHSAPVFVKHFMLWANARMTSTESHPWDELAHINEVAVGYYRSGSSDSSIISSAIAAMSNSTLHSDGRTTKSLIADIVADKSVAFALADTGILEFKSWKSSKTLLFLRKLQTFREPELVASMIRASADMIAAISAVLKTDKKQFDFWMILKNPKLVDQSIRTMFSTTKAAKNCINICPQELQSLITTIAAQYMVPPFIYTPITGEGHKADSLMVYMEAYRDCRRAIMFVLCGPRITYQCASIITPVIFPSLPSKNVDGALAQAMHYFDIKDVDNRLISLRKDLYTMDVKILARAWDESVIKPMRIRFYGFTKAFYPEPTNTPSAPALCSLIHTFLSSNMSWNRLICDTGIATPGQLLPCAGAMSLTGTSYTLPHLVSASPSLTVPSSFSPESIPDITVSATYPYTALFDQSTMFTDSFDVTVPSLFSVAQETSEITWGTSQDIFPSTRASSSPSGMLSNPTSISYFLPTPAQFDNYQPSPLWDSDFQNPFGLDVYSPLMDGNISQVPPATSESYRETDKLLDPDALINFDNTAMPGHLRETLQILLKELIDSGPKSWNAFINGGGQARFANLLTETQAVVPTGAKRMRYDT